ncbi:hypothetical protein M899_0505 [Bacteriovorax sp. BSW11_IV]|nr:hypothetical protein M899_0505 [Bacteriovorax sp. BSW11_IV]
MNTEACYTLISILTINNTKSDALFFKRALIIQAELTPHEDIVISNFIIFREKRI